MERWWNFVGYVGLLGREMLYRGYQLNTSGRAIDRLHFELHVSTKCSIGHCTEEAIGEQASEWVEVALSYAYDNLTAVCDNTFSSKASPSSWVGHEPL